ncbi:MAG: two-component system, sensor histidine kinase and response regulator [Methanolobus sp.]|uniref:PAS domain S-box protein n=1 Tax=Methanolobus sp. TaxID=1874737 RepID=UPI00258F6BDC|nr:PAS domain S-box protein [Methanolobus sp.]MDK2830959.1 two-component system, sensor histidine kinase and response regulator [Methanolobus sp.]
MTKNYEENLKLKKLVAYSEELFQSSADETDYDRITEMMNNISGARYAAFILFDENINAYVTKSVHASNDHIKKASHILNLELVGKVWDKQTGLENKIQNSIITRFSSIHELTKGLFPETPILLLEKTFNTGQTIIANIVRNDFNLGYFVLIYHAKEELLNEELIEVFSRQVGLMLERKKTEEKLQFQFRYQKMMSKISSSFLSVSDDKLDKTIDEALDKCRELFEVERAFVFLYSDDKKSLKKCYECCSDGIEPQADSFIDMKLSDYPWFENKLGEHDHIYVPDTEKLPPEAEAEKNKWKEYSIRSTLHIPLTESSGIIGFLGFNSIREQKWSDEQITLLKVLAGIIVSALEKRAEREELQIQKKRLSDAQRIGKTGSWEFDMNTGIVHASKEAFRLYGLKDNSITIRQVQSLVLPQFRPELDRALKDLIEHNKPYYVEFDMKRPYDGEIRHMSSIAEYQAEKNIVAGTLQDITEQKEAEKKIAEKEVWKHELIKDSMDGIVVLDMLGGVYEANQRYADMLGYSLDEIKNMHAWDWDKNIDIEQLPWTLKSTRKYDRYIETQHQKKDGTIIDVEISSSSAVCGDRELLFCVCRDITDRKRSQDELKNRTQLLDIALDATCAGIWDVDLLTGNIELQGLESWKKITGYEITDFSNYNLTMWQQLIHPDDSEDVISKFTNTASGKNDHYMAEYRMLHKKGYWVWVRAHGRVASYDKDGKALHVYGTHISIDENKKAEEKAKAASQAKSDFLANISHEIRTPLNGIIGFSDLLIESQLSPSQLHHMQTIQASANSLLDLINDVLDISKIEAGKLELENEKFDLRELCEQIADMLKYTAHAKGIELLLNISSEIPDFIVADRIRLRQVLVNLLGNAIKFTITGEVEMEVHIDKIHPDCKADIRFTVTDTGIGIPADRQKEVFEAFSQADNSISRKYGGTGLGLSISNRLLEKMDSRLELSSEEGNGSIFSFSVLMPYEYTGKSDKNKSPEYRKVLIVDDNVKNCHNIRSILKDEGVVTEIAYSAKEALDVFKDKSDDIKLIILDKHMPVMTGNELLQDIRADITCFYHNIPAIIMQDSTDINDVEEMENDKSLNGKTTEKLTHTITKPVKKAEIIESIIHLLSGEKDTGNEIYHKLKQAENKHDVKYKILIAEDNETNMLLTSTIISRILPDADILKATNGSKAVELFRDEQPDLILMDIQMPEISGYDATTMIRNIETTKGIHTPIIALTAGTFRGEEEKCLEAGLDDYAPKPIVSETIRQVCEKWLFKESDTEHTGSNWNKERDNNNLNTAHFNSAWLQSNTDGSKELYNKLIAMAMKSFVQNYEQMCTAHSNNDMEEVSTIAHKTKGTALNTGFNILASIAEDIEKSANSNSEINIVELLDSMKKEIDYLSAFFNEQYSE